MRGDWCCARLRGIMLASDQRIYGGGAMPGQSIMRERRERWARLKADPDFARECIVRVASGDSIVAVAADADVAYNTVYGWLTDEHGESLQRARKARAAALADTMEHNADLVDAGRLNPKAASVSSNIRQWLATRYDRDTFGDQSRVDMHVRGSIDMNLQAVRALVSMGSGDTYDGESEVVDSGQDTASIEQHPLL